MGLKRKKAKLYKKGKEICEIEILEGIEASKGLMFRRKLRKKGGVLLKLPKQSFFIHTFFVFFPIDLFFLDKNLRVVEKVSLSPFKIYKPKKDAEFLLETKEKTLKLKVGDKLELCFC